MQQQTCNDEGVPKAKMPFWLRTVYVSVSGKSSAVEKTEFDWALLKPISVVLLALLAVASVGVFLKERRLGEVSVGDSVIVHGLVFTSPSQVVMESSDSSIWVLEGAPAQVAKDMEQGHRVVCAQGHVAFAKSKDKMFGMRLNALQDCGVMLKR